MRQAAVGIGPGEEHQHVGPSAERAPGLDPVDGVARLSVRTLRRCGRGLDPAHVRAVVGLGDGHRGHDLARGQLRQPLLLLLLGPAPHEGPGEDLRSGDERAADAERTPGELLGGDDHAQVLAVTTLGPAAVLGGRRQPEGAHLGQAGDDALGNVAVGPVHVLGDGCDLLVGEGPEAVLHELEVRIEVAGAGRRGQVRQEVRMPVGGEEVAGAGQRSIVVQAPRSLASDEAALEVVQRLGHERAGQAGFELPRRAVVEHRARHLHPRRGVGQVVSERLMDLRPSALGQLLHPPPDDVVREIDGGRRRLQVRGSHGR